MEFQEENAFNAVPVSWLELREDQLHCYWPKRGNILVSLERGDPPPGNTKSNEWYKCNILGNKGRPLSTMFDYNQCSSIFVIKNSTVYFAY